MYRYITYLFISVNNKGPFPYHHHVPTLSTHALPHLTPPSTPVPYHAADHDHMRGVAWGAEASPATPVTHPHTHRILQEVREYSWKNHAD